MGTVVLARHRMASHEVAIKISTDGVVASVEALARLTREGKLLASLRHPNIVRLYDVADIGRGRYGIVMEYVRGVSLSRIIGEVGGLPFDRCQSILWDLCAALSHAHSRGVVHRDVKPQNVIIRTDSWVAKLCDFGIARGGAEEADATAPDFVAGTPGYMAPEQIDGMKLDGRSDLYSLGVLGWEMLTGAQPWRRMPLFDILYHQKHSELPDLAVRRPGTPPNLLFALEGALAKDRRLRWNSASEMIAQLELDGPTDRLLALRDARRRQAGASQSLYQADEPSDDALRQEESTTLNATTALFIRNNDESPTAAASTEVFLPRVSPVDDWDTYATSELSRGTRKPREDRVRLLRRLRRRRDATAAALVLVGLLAGTAATFGFLVRGSSEPARATRTFAQLAPLDSSQKRAVASPSDADVIDPIPKARAPLAPMVPSLTIAGALPAPMPFAFIPSNSSLRDRLGSPTRAEWEPPASTGEFAGEVENPELALFHSTLRESQRFIVAKQLSEAERVVDSAIAKAPRKGALYALRARIRASRGNIRDAWTDVEMADRTNGKWDVLALETALRIDLGGRAEARASLTEEVREALVPRRMLDPDRAFGLARALIVAGDTATALTVLEQTTTPDPTAAPRFQDAALASLADEPRFIALRRKVLGRR